MSKKICFLLIFILMNFALAQQVSEDSLEHMLQRAKLYYNNGEYESAINELETALQYLKQLEATDQVEAYKYFAFSYVALGDKEKAKSLFKTALRLNPSLSLDPATVSPKIIKVFEEAKAEMELEPAPIEPEPVEPEVFPKEHRVSRTSALMRSCLVPGLGQIYKGHSGKGKKILIAAGITLGASVTALIIRNSAHNKYLDIEAGAPQSDFDDAYNKYKAWENISVISVLCFGCVYAYNIYDVFFSKPVNGFSMRDKKDKGFYWHAGVDRVKIGYVMSF
jgi:tetratricopeptide (TPR) repeat protein